VSLIDYSPEDHIAVVRLNRPERLNAKSPEMGEELIDAFRKFNADDADWVGILTGNRRAFCAGRDMKARPRSFPMGWLVHARLAWPTPMAAALNTAENLFDDQRPDCRSEGAPAAGAPRVPGRGVRRDEPRASASPLFGRWPRRQIRLADGLALSHQRSAASAAAE
jgi:hypothetical protein